ncbi:uncharacterized protein LOC135145171 [Zophobas morio]|uniref:uncharacterized protein LOC135145171 n=1 Tax=Zophobas morio TaxID=2755281 RepID=UPI003083ABFC
MINRAVVARIPLIFGVFEVVLYTNDEDTKEHLAICYGGLDKIKGSDNLCVRVHSECFTGEVLGSCRCDCGEQLRTALHKISQEGCGVLIFLRQEGRGIGLLQKLRAYNLQDLGYDTLEANCLLGFKCDERTYEIARFILNDLEVNSIRIMSNNPAKIDSLRQQGVKVVDQIPTIATKITEETLKYLTTKVERMHHSISLEDLRPLKEGNKSLQRSTFTKQCFNHNSSKFPTHLADSELLEVGSSCNGSTDPDKSCVCHSGNSKFPFITLSYAQSIDGSIASSDRRPLDISCLESAKMTHSLRAAHSAILVGINTVLSDNPQLTVRLVTGESPRPVVLDSFLKIPLESHILRRAPIIFCSKNHDISKKKILEKVGATVLPVVQTNRSLDLREILETLKKLELHSVMVEGGATVIESFLESKLVNKCVITISPRFIGGLKSVKKPHANLPRLVNVASSQYGSDTVIVGRPVWL